MDVEKKEEEEEEPETPWKNRRGLRRTSTRPRLADVLSNVVGLREITQVGSIRFAKKKGARWLLRINLFIVKLVYEWIS